MIISVPPDTQSVSIRREGERAIIILDHEVLSEASDGLRPLPAEENANERPPQRARRVPLPVIAGVCLIVVGAAVGHWLWSPAKSSGPHTADTLQMPLLRAPESATRRSLPAAPEAAPVPNTAFGLE
ncbi:hypothetical protein [Gluconobacter cerinus]|uniref:hypothetical protein n=1 Tax=Gluconobacter cerinus TaxID=38307 RepID=UPI001C0593EC|nr:hypothetical protein [Gluconobacter cerinus]